MLKPVHIPLKMYFTYVVFVLIWICLFDNAFSRYGTNIQRHYKSSNFMNSVEKSQPGFYDFVDPFYKKYSKIQSSTIRPVNKQPFEQEFKRDGSPSSTPYTSTLQTTEIPGLPNVGTSATEGIISGLSGSPSTSNVSPTGKGLCVGGKCAGFSFKDIRKEYGDLFHTSTGINELERLNRIALKGPLIPTKPGGGAGQPGKPGEGAGQPGKPGFGSGRPGSTGPSSSDDGDTCCPTTASHTNRQFLTNTDGIEREIVNFIGGDPPLQQFIPVGECTAPRTSKCRDCRIEQRLHFLLVMDPDAKQFPPVEFDKFYIKSYCSCKNG